MDTGFRAASSCVAGVVLLVVSFGASTEWPGQSGLTSRIHESFTGDHGRVVSLRHDINLLNLLNGLYLTDEQVDQIIRLARQAEAYRTLCREEMAKSAAATADAYEKLRREAMVGNGFSQDTERCAMQLHQQRIETREQLSKQLFTLETRLKRVLTASQIQVVEEFKPCLIPPRNLKDPSRVGQADDGSQGENILNRVRSIPPGRYVRLRRGIAERFVERTMKYAPKTGGEERLELVHRAIEIFDRVRSLPEEEYVVARAELGDHLMEPKTKYEMERERLAHLAGTQFSLGKVGKYMLDPSIIPLLEERRQLAGTYRQPAESQISGVPAAERYDPSRQSTRIKVGGEVRVGAGWVR